MSFKQNDTITPDNYEEYFILYMDNELTASQKAMVDSFVLQHPQLAEELEALLSTKLPPDDISFAGKDELLSTAMQATVVDEKLLLYIDDESPAAEKVLVATRIESEAGYALQHSLLLQTKLNATDVVSHPDKKELYRHERRTVPFGMWMRVAAAVVLLLISTWLFFLNKNKQDDGSMAERGQPKNTRPIVKDKPSVIEQVVPKEALPKEATALIKQPAATPLKKVTQTTPQAQNDQQNAIASFGNKNSNEHREVMHIDTSRFATNIKVNLPIAVNKTITLPSVTSKQDSSYNRQNNPVNNPEVDWAVETEKKAPARGFFRKVSRFIERKTGIGTVNADNELLVGVVALKLK